MAPPTDAGGQRPASPTSGSALRLRFISAAVLLPIAFGGAWLGGVWWVMLVAAFAWAMVWEWSGIVTDRRTPTVGFFNMAPAGLVAAIAVAAAVGLTDAGWTAFSLMLLVIGAILAALLARADRPGWQALGVFYIGLPSLTIIWIRDEPNGLAVLAWMLSLVIAVDTGAYVAGRTIGGPKLAPRISPKKTWAGLAGGVAAALLIGWIWAFLLDLPRFLPLILVSGVLAVVEQAGDLAESAFKRRFGVKDSSGLIPGHGGVLDRVDGLLAVALAVGLIGYFEGGLAGWMR
jgi:phosphatidate cytidylyltransferase